MEENTENKKLSYEDLERLCQQLSEQARNLYVQLQEANLSNLYTRLNFLFKVVENSAMFDFDFVSKCTNEIVNLIAIEEEKEDEATK